MKNENQEYIIKLAVGTSLYDITPTGRIVNLLLSGGDIMGFIAEAMKWLLHIKRFQFKIKIEISVKIRIHKD